MAFINLSSIIKNLSPNEDSIFEPEDTFKKLGSMPLSEFIRKQAFALFNPIRDNYKAIINALVDSGAYEDDFKVYEFINENIESRTSGTLKSFIRYHVFSPASFMAVDMMKRAGLTIDECVSKAKGMSDGFAGLYGVTDATQISLSKEVIYMAVEHLYDVVIPEAVKNGYDVQFNMEDSNSLLCRSNSMSASIALRIPIGVNENGLYVFTSKGRGSKIGDSNFISEAVLLDSSYHKSVCASDNPGDEHAKRYFDSFHDGNMSGTDEVYMKSREHIYRCICIANKALEFSSNGIKTGTYEWHKRWGAVVCDSNLLMSVQRSVTSKMSALKRRDIDKYNELLGEYDRLELEYDSGQNYIGDQFLINIFYYGTLSALAFRRNAMVFEPYNSFKEQFAKKDSELINEEELKSYLDGMSLDVVLILNDNKVIKIPSKFFGISYPNEITDLFSGERDADNVVDGLIGVYNMTITATIDASNVAMNASAYKEKLSVDALFENGMYEKHKCQIRVNFGGIETRK
nr:MAG TPA: hypothetical protein [Caudoviricetes sp.]